MLRYPSPGWIDRIKMKKVGRAVGFHADLIIGEKMWKVCARSENKQGEDQSRNINRS